MRRSRKDDQTASAASTISRGKATPSNRSRAVRSSPARSTTGRSAVPPKAMRTSRTPVGCSIASSFSRPSGSLAKPRGRRARQDAGGRDRDGGEDADRGVAFMRNEAARRDRAARGGRRDQAHFGHDLVANVAEIHQRAGRQTYLFEPRLQLMIGVQLIARLMAGAPQGGGLDDHHRHAVVDQRRLDARDLVDEAACRQKSAANGALGVEEIDDDRRGGARRAVDPRAAGIIHPAARRLHREFGDRAGVQGAHLDPGQRTRRRDQTALDGEGRDAGEDIAAIGRDIDHRPVEQDLAEEEIDIDPGLIGHRDDRHFAGQRMGAAEAIDLTRVRRAHHRQDDGIPRRRIARQIVGEEISAFRCAAAHQRASHALLHDRVSWTRASPGAASSPQTVTPRPPCNKCILSQNL